MRITREVLFEEGDYPYLHVMAELASLMLSHVVDGTAVSSWYINIVKKKGK
jgi:hypothetical protein